MICTPYHHQSLELQDRVKHYQPNSLLNSRLGNGAYDYVSLGDNEYPRKPPENRDETDFNSLDGYKYSPYGLHESPGTLNSSWGFKYYDQEWRSPETVAERHRKLNSMGINYLLNVGPNGLGRIPPFSQEVLKRAWITEK